MFMNSYLLCVSACVLILNKTMNYKFGVSDDKDKKLVMLRRKYFHNILDYNKLVVNERKDFQRMEKQ